MISINALVFKDHYESRGNDFKFTKKIDGNVECEVIQKLDKSKVLVNIYINFSKDDKFVFIGCSEYIYVGKKKKSFEVLNLIEEINKEEKFLKLVISGEYIEASTVLEFIDDFKGETIEVAIINLLYLLDSKYKKFMKLLYSS